MGIKPKVEKVNKKESKKSSVNPVKLTAKNIEMKDIMKGLGIEVDDIVHVNGNWLKCNEKYDLVTLEDRYNPSIPNWILGMVSGKYHYKVFSLKHEVFTGEFDGVC